MTNTAPFFGLELGPDLDMLRETVRAFTAAEIAPRAANVQHYEIEPLNTIVAAVSIERNAGNAVSRIRQRNSGGICVVSHDVQLDLVFMPKSQLVDHDVRKPIMARIDSEISDVIVVELEAVTDAAMTLDSIRNQDCMVSDICAADHDILGAAGKIEQNASRLRLPDVVRFFATAEDEIAENFSPMTKRELQPGLELFRELAGISIESVEDWPSDLFANIAAVRRPIAAFECLERQHDLGPHVRIAPQFT